MSLRASKDPEGKLLSISHEVSMLMLASPRIEVTKLATLLSEPDSVGLP